MIELTDDGIARATQNPRLTPRVEGIIMNCLGKTCKFRFRSLSTPNRRFSQSRPIPPPPQDWTGSVAFICLSLHEARLLCCPPRLQNGSTVQMVRHGPTRRTTCGCLCNRSASVVTMNARVRGFGTRVGQEPRPKGRRRARPALLPRRPAMPSRSWQTCSIGRRLSQGRTPMIV